MTRKTPAGLRAAATWPLLLGVLALAFLLKACAEQPPTETTAVTTTPQLGGGPSPVCSPTPCVVVKVTEKGNNPPSEEGVVTLVHGGLAGIGPFDLDGKALRELTVNGVATFHKKDLLHPDGYNFALGGYCAYVTPQKSKDVQIAGDTHTVPTALAAALPSGPAAFFHGAVSITPSRSGTLNLGLYEQSCLWHYTKGSDPSNAPFVLDASSAVSVTLKVSEGVVVDLNGRFPDGTVNTSFPAWGIFALDVDQNGNLLAPGVITTKIPWADGTRVGAGFRIGLLASTGFGNTNSLRGWPPEEFVEIEGGLKELDGDEVVFSLERKKTPKGGKKDPSLTTLETKFLPVLCQDLVVPSENQSDGGGYADIFDRHYGYIGASALDGNGDGTFVADLEKINIFYDVVPASKADVSCPNCITLHFRGKQIGPDGFEQTMNKVVVDDIGLCPGTFGYLDKEGGHVSESGTPEFRVRTECRRDPANLNNFEVFHTLKVIHTRQIEFRLEAVVDRDPNAPSNDPSPPEERGMTVISIPTGQCPLNAGFKSTDPKWDIIG